MACSTTRRATTVKSCSVPVRFGLSFAMLERLGIAHFWHELTKARRSGIFKLTHYPPARDREKSIEFVLP